MMAMVFAVIVRAVTVRMTVILTTKVLTVSKVGMMVRGMEIRNLRRSEEDLPRQGTELKPWKMKHPESAATVLRWTPLVLSHVAARKDRIIQKNAMMIMMKWRNGPERSSSITNKLKTFGLGMRKYILENCSFRFVN